MFGLHPLSALAGLVVGVGGCAIYSVVHGNQLSALGEKIDSAVAKAVTDLKAHLATEIAALKSKV